MNMKLLSKMQRGRRRRFMDVLKEEMQNGAVAKKDARDRRGQRHTICCDDP